MAQYSTRRFHRHSTHCALTCYEDSFAIESFATRANAAFEVDFVENMHDAGEEEGEEESPFDHRVHSCFFDEINALRVVHAYAFKQNSLRS